MKILVVDDSRAMRRIVQRTLRQAGYRNHQVAEAENGAGGLEAVRNDPPDLILSDWHMPEMSGLEFLKALREEGYDIPFGFVTSESAKQVREIAAEAGADFLLAKPFTPEDMQKALEAYVPC